jgi:hypothetical protein
MPPAYLILAATLSSPPLPVATPPEAAPAPAIAPAAPAVAPAAPASAAPVSIDPAPATATPPTPPPPSAAMVCPPPPPPQIDVKKGTPLIASGLALTGVTYLFSALSGAITIDKARKRAKPDDPNSPANEAHSTDRERKRGQLLMVPIVGPFLAMKHTDSAVQQFGNVFNGTVQITGIVLAIAGAVRQSRYNQAKRWGLAAAPGPEGARISFDVRF